MKRKRPNRTAEKVNRNSTGTYGVMFWCGKARYACGKGQKRRIQKQKSRPTFFGGAGISDIYTVHTA